jgi:hypothetical protein
MEVRLRPEKAFDLVVQEETDIPQSPVAGSIGFGGISRQQLLTCSLRYENHGVFALHDSLSQDFKETTASLQVERHLRN